MTLLANTEEFTDPLSAEGTARSTVAGAPLTIDELNKIDALLARVQLSGSRHDLSSG